MLTSPEAPQKAPRKPAKVPQEPAPTTATWEAYAAAYAERYHGHRPARNAKVSGQLANLLARIPQAEAPFVAEFYVWHNDAFYARKGHPVGLLLDDAEKLHMEWATGRRVNAHAARMSEQTEGNPFLAISRKLREEEAADVVEQQED